MRGRGRKIEVTLATEFENFFVSTGLASLRELKEVYSYRDANVMWEVHEVNAENERRRMVAEAQSAAFRRRYG